ncbi:hypothetical protein [Phytohabitans houttuyneae]|nr:hypothetical protein [Phytohabitans houttuyneae]
MEWEFAGILIAASCCLWATAGVALALGLMWWRRRGGRSHDT